MDNWITTLARQHYQKDSVANVHGLILHTDVNPHVNMVLNNSDYWRAFDALSGSQWNIFASKVQSGHSVMTNPMPGTFARMVSTWKEPKENEALLADFGISSSRDLPVFVVFAENDEGNVVSCQIKIRDGSQQEAYESIREIVDMMSMAIERIDTKYRNTSTRAYYAVIYAIDNYKEWQLLKCGGKLFAALKSIIS